jgi:hypothetical protein
MLIYGTKSFKGKSYQTNVLCTHCNIAGQVVFQTAVKCIHVFWIPMFPIKKFAIGQCQHCKKVYDNNSFTGEMLNVTNDLKKNQKPKILHFTGLLIIAFSIIYFEFPKSDKQKKEDKIKLNQAKEELLLKLRNPMINDIYYVRNGDTVIDKNQYKRSLILKVYNVSENSVDFKLSNLIKLDKKLSTGRISVMPITNDFFLEENISGGVVTETKSVLETQKMMNNLEIYQIER